MRWRSAVAPRHVCRTHHRRASGTLAREPPMSTAPADSTCRRQHGLDISPNNDRIGAVVALENLDQRTFVRTSARASPASDVRAANHRRRDGNDLVVGQFVRGERRAGCATSATGGSRADRRHPVRLRAHDWGFRRRRPAGLRRSSRRMGEVHLFRGDGAGSSASLVGARPARTMAAAARGGRSMATGNPISSTPTATVSTTRSYGRRAWHGCNG